MRSSPLALVAATLLLTACGSGQDGSASQQSPSVEGAWVRLPIVTGRPGAAYFTVRGGQQPTRLTAVSSPAADRVELHESSMDGGIMRMGQLQEVTVPAGSTAEFKPGGNHAMMFGINRAIKAGDKIRLSFTFDQGPPITVEADTRAAGSTDAGH